MQLESAGLGGLVSVGFLCGPAPKSRLLQQSTSWSQGGSLLPVIFDRSNLAHLVARALSRSLRQATSLEFVVNSLGIESKAGGAVIFIVVHRFDAGVLLSGSA